MKRSQKIIIGIHGLGNKPPKETLEKWWRQAIDDGLRINNFPKTNFDFDLVYWADILHPNPLNNTEANNTNPLFLSEQYSSNKYPTPSEPLTFRKKAIEYIEKYYEKTMVNGALSLNHPILTDLFIHLHLRDLESYYSSTCINHEGRKHLARDVITERLIKTLINHRNKKILLIAHSMGAIIAYETLIQRLPEIEIDTLVTIGSPLGQKFVINKFKIMYGINLNNKLMIPENIIRCWYNLSDLEDQVAINSEISDLYMINSNHVKIVDKLVKNNFFCDGESNPHKAFGYLRTPEFSKTLYAFLIYNQPRLFEWLRKKLRKKIITTDTN
jgi:hypothetical protein